MDFKLSRMQAYCWTASLLIAAFYEFTPGNAQKVDYFLRKGATTMDVNTQTIVLCVLPSQDKKYF